jgi:hypothetical protein
MAVATVKVDVNGTGFTGAIATALPNLAYLDNRFEELAGHTCETFSVVVTTAPSVDGQITTGLQKIIGGGVMDVSTGSWTTPAVTVIPLSTNETVAVVSGSLAVGSYIVKVIGVGAL